MSRPSACAYRVTSFTTGRIRSNSPMLYEGPTLAGRCIGGDATWPSANQLISGSQPVRTSRPKSASNSDTTRLRFCRESLSAGAPGRSASSSRWKWSQNTRAMSVSHGRTWNVERSGMRTPSATSLELGPIGPPWRLSAKPPAERYVHASPRSAIRSRCRAGMTLPSTRPCTETYCR